MTEREWTLIEDAFHEYGALVFPGQHLCEEEQVEFGERFGEIEILSSSQKYAAISNVAPDGKVFSREEKIFEGLRGNEDWHTDSSNMPLAAKASILSAHVIPSTGGETELADMRAAYDKLAPAIKRKIADLSAYHSLYASQTKAGYSVKTGEAYGFHKCGMPLRPLVKVHPVTGRKSLFISQDAFRIPGMDDVEARALLEELLAFATQSRHIYAHKWQQGDVIVWDNRCILHRACPYNYSEPRIFCHVARGG